MINRLMITAAAAALIAGTGFASAQGMNREGSSAGSGVQQSAPSSDRGSSAATPMNRDSGSDQGMKSTQSEEKMQPQGGKKGEKLMDALQAWLSEGRTLAMGAVGPCTLSALLLALVERPADESGGGFRRINPSRAA